MRSRLVAATCLAGAAGLLALATAGRVWSRATVATQHLKVTGTQVMSSLPALSLSIAAVAVAVLAARAALRQVAALVGVVVSGALIAVAVGAHRNAGTALASRGFAVAQRELPASNNAWWIVCLACGVVAVAGFAVVVIAGRSWSGPSARYDAPGAASRTADPEVAAWDALDRGDDPTV